MATMTPEVKKWIDEQSYQTLLQRWRFAPVGDVMFQGETGDYYAKVMTEKRGQEPDGGVGASKRVGW
jgi:hypothetical protein